jgi:hypothetical protein
MQNLKLAACYADGDQRGPSSGRSGLLGPDKSPCYSHRSKGSARRKENTIFVASTSKISRTGAKARTAAKTAKKSYTKHASIEKAQSTAERRLEKTQALKNSLNVYAQHAAQKFNKLGAKYRNEDAIAVEQQQPTSLISRSKSSMEGNAGTSGRATPTPVSQYPQLLKLQNTKPAQESDSIFQDPAAIKQTI